MRKVNYDECGQVHLTDIKEEFGKVSPKRAEMLADKGFVKPVAQRKNYVSYVNGREV